MADDNAWLAAFQYAAAIKQQRLDAAKAKTLGDPNQSAFAYVRQWLGQLGFDATFSDRLLKFAIDHGIEDPEQLKLWVYQQPEFARRFPAIAKMQEAGDVSVPDPATYVAYEEKFNELVKQSGLNFLYDAKDGRGKQLVAQLLENHVSPAELAGRIQNGYAKVTNAPPQVREAMRAYFGAQSDAALAAFFLDPQSSESIVTKAAEMAQIGGAYAQMGLGAYGLAGQAGAPMPQWLAEKLQQNGLTGDRALQVMASASELSPLYDETVGEGIAAGGVKEPGRNGRTIDPNQPAPDRLNNPDGGPLRTVPNAGRNTGLSTVTPVGNDLTAEHGVQAVAGVDATAMELVRRRLAERKSAMGGGGGADVAQQGVALGSGGY